MHIRTNRSAFSLLEVVFVIVILGIVASLGSEMIAKVYENYILQRAQHRASVKTELVATQIANRLRYAIPGTIVRRRSSDWTTETLNQNMSLDGDQYNVLQWVAYDGDSFEAISTDTDRKPGWSGFCDINISNSTVISSPGSNVALAHTIIQNLSKNASGTATKALSNAALYFPYDSIEHNLSATTSLTGENITLDSNASRIVEHYKLAWSSYALVVENGDLYLYYNFTPSPAATIATNSTRSSLLLKHVTNFKFQGAGRTTRFKICKEERISEDVNISSCKEKAVF